VLDLKGLLAKYGIILTPDFCKVLDLKGLLAKYGIILTRVSLC